jgi:membrane protease YdiL (CAAX protease family)
MTTRIRPIRSLLIYVVVIFLGGALIAPWVYKVWVHIHQSPFHRVFGRCLMALALAGIWPLLRSLDVASWRDVGIVSPKGQWHRLVAGFIFGFGSLVCVVLIVLGAHGFQIKTDVTASQLVRGLAGAAATAIVVAVMEELLFRGTIFGALRKTMDWRAALVLSSLIFAILHFIGRTDDAGAVTWSSGLEFLPVMFRDLANPDVFIPMFFNLTLVGLMLGLAYQRTGNLCFSIGLHAGWIFWVKAYGLFAPPGTEARHWLWGTPKLIDGWLAFAVLAIAMFVLPRWLPRKPGEARA